MADSKKRVTGRWMSLGKSLFLVVALFSAVMVAVFASTLAVRAKSLPTPDPGWRLSSASVLLPERPLWLPSHIPAELARHIKNQADVPLTEAGLAAAVYHRIREYPWVKAIRSVEIKYPDIVRIDLEYRQPACLIAFPEGFLAVDTEGVLLPSADFTAESLEKLYVLKGVDRLPPIKPGQVWRDGRVIEAARLAHRLGQEPLKNGFRALIPHVVLHPLESEEIVFWLQHDAGARILWGHAPGAEKHGEPSPEEKLKAFSQWLQENLPRLASLGDVVLDLSCR
jgi:hypothetical protein